MQLLTATLTKVARQVTTKYGIRTVADCIDENGNTQTIWRPENDPTLIGLAINSRLMLSVDGKGKINLVENIPQAIATSKTDNKPIYQGMNNETKKQVASYVTEMANLFNFCLKQIDQTVENITPEDRRAIATTMFISCQKKYGL